MDYSDIANDVFYSLLDSDFHCELYKSVLKSIENLEVKSISDLSQSIDDILQRNPDLNQEINNFIFSRSFFHLEKFRWQSNYTNKDPDNYLFVAQVSWEKRMLKSINAMCSEFDVPLSRRRTEKDIKEMREKWGELSIFGKDTSSIRPVYAPKDFLEVLIKLKNNNCRLTLPQDSTSWLCNWGLIQVPLKIKTLQELRIQFSDLAIGQQQTGVDDTNRSNCQFELDRKNLAKSIIDSKNAAACQEFSKTGCQLENRRQLWYLIFNLKLNQSDRNYYIQLKQSVLEYDLLIDSLIFMDVKLTATNDDAYFVFEDYLYQILLPLTRDTELLKVFDNSTASPAKTYINGRSDSEEFSVIYPPSGLIPFHGFSLLAAPLCYFVDDTIELYMLFKELYLRYFHKLHIISDDPNGILSLCLLFEFLLQSLEPDLFFYLRSVGIQPIRLAFKWIMRAFSGFLSADQTLLLWDRIIGYESLELLSLLAVSVFQFRKANLYLTTSLHTAEAVLADLTTLQVIPLLQLTLFSR